MDTGYFIWLLLSNIWNNIAKYIFVAWLIRKTSLPKQVVYKAYDSK